MKKGLYILLLSSGYFIAHADTQIYYDSQGFENPTSFTVGSYPDVSSNDLSGIYPSTPQPFNLFTGSTVETLQLGGSAYTDISGIGGNYTLGMMGSPVGTPVLTTGGVVQTTNYDSFTVPVDVASCPAVESVTIDFDLSLAALYGTTLINPVRLYFPDTMWNGTAVAPMVEVKLFDEQNIDINFNTELQAQTESGVRIDNNRLTPFQMEWSSHSVTFPLTQADLIGSTALLNISGAGSAAANENTYVALDNIVVSLNTPIGTSCSVVGKVTEIPSSNTNTLIVLLLSIFAVVGIVLYHQNKVQK